MRAIRAYFSKNKLRLLLVPPVLLFVWMLFVCAAGYPTADTVAYCCGVCRASKWTGHRFLIPTPPSIIDNDFSSYYRKQVDPEHEHVWMFGYVSRCYGFWDGMSAHGTPDPLRLQYEPASAILRSLPDTQTRKDFFEQLRRRWLLARRSQDSAALSKLYDASYELNDAYEESPKRTDWPQLLKKVGLYPKLASKT